MRRWTLGWPLVLGFVLGVAMIKLGLAYGTDAEDGWHNAVRWTARAGFPLLLLAFTASSLARLWPNDLTRGLLRGRRWWGLGFAACHSAHLCAITNFFAAKGEAIPPVALYGGGAVYAVMYAMAFTSFNAAQRAMGVWWTRLHRTGIHILWAVFTLAYLGKSFVPESRVLGIGFAALGLAALGLRIAARRKRAHAHA